jgi:hypothetical protein
VSAPSFTEPATLAADVEICPPIFLIRFSMVWHLRGQALVDELASIGRSNALRKPAGPRTEVVAQN